MWHHHSFSGHCTPLDPWNIEPDFTPCYQLELMTLFLLAFWKTNYYISLRQRQCHLQERCIETCSFCLWIYIVALNSFEDVESKTVGWTGGTQLPTIFVVSAKSASSPNPGSHGSRRLPGGSAWGNTPLHLAAATGHVEAAELLLSKGAAVDAKGDEGPGPRRQEAGPKIPSLQLGALQKVFRAWNSAERCLHFQ